MSDDVFRQADALMRRHRSFVAQATGGDTSPSTASSADATTGREEDIPLLTDIVATPEAAAAPSLDELLDQLHQEIEAALSNWLIEALPAAVANASQHILVELDAKARHTLLPQIQTLIEQHRPEPR